jgi:RNA polymerase sigma factor (sigma-70 family)
MVITCDHDLAQDVVQEVMVRVQPRWRRIVAMEEPEAYVKRMVLNEFLSWRRRWAVRVVPLAGDELESAAGAQADASSAVGERDELLRLIAALPPKQRAVIALYYYENRSAEEIADLLGCRPVTVRSQLSRALAVLRTAMRRPRPVSP